MRPRWFGMSTAYTIAKYNMSMCALGHSDEFRDEIAGNGFSIYKSQLFLTKVEQ